MHNIFNKKSRCKGMNKILLMTFVFIIAISLILLLYSYKSYEDFKSYQRDIAVQSTLGTSNNIAIFMSSLKTSLAIFVAGHQKSLSQLQQSPDNSSAYSHINNKLSQYFSDYYAFTIADNTGKLLYDDFGEQIGDLCRSDIHQFALSHAKVDTYIHPGPEQYHFDIMLNWRQSNKNEIFFASFRTKHLSHLLYNAQLPGHKLVLLRNDRPDLIEIMATGNRSNTREKTHLTQQQHERILSLIPVSGTRWVLADIANESLFSNYIGSLLAEVAVIFIIFILIAGILLRRIAMEERKRQIIEQNLQESHLQLEERVEERTAELKMTIDNLKFEIEKSFKLSSAIEQTDDIIAITNSKGIIEYVNPSFERVTGYLLKEIVGGTLDILKSGKQNSDFYRRMWHRLKNGYVFHSVFVNRCKDGHFYHEEKTISPLRNQNGEITHYVATGKDISEKVRTEQRIQHLAYHDILTELPNRLLFHDRLEHALSQATRNESILAILFIDLDRFKIINDSLGHAMGDNVLQVVAERLIHLLRESDTIARLGGDEFALILENVTNVAEIISTTQRILDDIARPFHSGKQALHTTASIGITIYPFENTNIDNLLKQADIAMYQAKANGGNSFQFYSITMGESATRRMTLENKLNGALERNEFILNYQPRIDLMNGRVTGAEALLRWHSPEFGIISPIEFIPLLEESGLILEVGKWVIHQACSDFIGLPENYRLAVNLSTKQFSDSELEKDIANILSKTGFNPIRLDIEITESLLAVDRDRVFNVLQTLHNAGIHISIDDFGTGYSSLSYLKDFPIDCIKIDRSFVINLEKEPENIKLINAIISMAHSLNMSVVTEGIETMEQLSILIDKGSDEGQGYLFSKPLPYTDFLDWLDLFNKKESAFDFLKNF